MVPLSGPVQSSGMGQSSGAIQSVYQSARLPSGLPSLPPTAPIPTQPYLGFSALAPPMNTQHANRARLASAAATIPRQPQVARRGSRSMSNPGRAAAPTLRSTRSGRGRITDCFAADSSTIRIEARVYPPTVCLCLCIIYLL
jgi:hypothetical protein